MNLLSLNQKNLCILVSLALFLPGFIWQVIDFTCDSSKTFKKLIMLERAVTQKTATGTINKMEEIKEKETIILLWSQWEIKNPMDICRKDYGIMGCMLTLDRRLYGTADAVIIHHPSIMYDRNSVPKQPRPHFQRWVWFNREPPLIVRNLDMLDNLINMTMTARTDSDIFFPYGHIEVLKEPQNVTIPTKSKLVSWVVSKWYPGAPRIAYYEELKKHVPIDVYGRGHLKLNWEDFHSTLSQYKFYLSFENSVYKDYITEKLWRNAFGSWAVPVVLGTSRKNYERFIPGDSFIHVDDFPSAKELAAYLLELDKDEEKYRKYFNWRSHYRVRNENPPSYMYCKVCEKIRETPRYQVYHSLTKWYLKDI